MKCAKVAGILSPKPIKLHLIIKRMFLVPTVAIAQFDTRAVFNSTPISKSTRKSDVRLDEIHFKGHGGMRVGSTPVRLGG